MNTITTSSIEEYTCSPFDHLLGISSGYCEGMKKVGWRLISEVMRKGDNSILI
jgi:hypothetical protein